MRNHMIPEVTTENFDPEVLQSELPVLVDFTADWCPPCKMLLPIIEELASKYEKRLRVVSVNGDQATGLTEQFDVYGYPTLILFQNGLPVERMVGYAPRPKLENKIVPYLAATVFPG